MAFIISRQRPASRVPRKWIPLLLAAALALSGCSGTQIASNSELATLSIGDVTAKLAEDIKPGPSGMDASESFRHWKHQFQYCSSCYTRDQLQNRFFGAYKPHCDAKRGLLSYLPSKYPERVECRTDAGNLIFAVYAKIESESANTLGNTVYKWFITADSFEPKSPTGSESISDEYSASAGGYYKRDKTREKIELQARLDQASKLAEGDKKAKAEAQRRRDEQVARDLPVIKTIGQKICTTVKGNQKRIVATAFGKPVYDRPVERDFVVTGFTEQVAGNRVRILISGIRSADGPGEDRSIDKLEGDAVWETGKPTWDEAANWRPCP